jgi:predicted dehydrogenase
MSIHYVVSAGPPPAGTWVVDPVAGGGRVIGECCHFVDLCSWLVGAPPNRVFARSLSRERDVDDSMVTLLSYPDGSVATLEYLGSASGELPKERIEISADGTTAQCDNFRTTRVVGGASHKTLNQDKGQEAAIEHVIDAVRGGKPSPFTLLELAATSAATFAMEESMRSGQAVDLEEHLGRYR